MERVGIYDAKAHLSEIVERVESGAEVVITRRGKAVARIVPMKATAKDSRTAAAKRIRQLREKWAIGRVSIRKLIDEGRR
jgi:prevent-host-death family protein